MKTRNYLSALALTAATALLTACSADGDTPGTNPNFPQDGVMRFTTSVADAVHTRSFGYDDTNVTTTDHHLWVTPTGDNPPADYPSYKNYLLHHTAEAGWGTYSDLGSDGVYAPATLLWQDKTTPVEVVASNFGDGWARIELSTAQSISVYASQTIDDFIKYSDPLYFKGTVNPALNTDATDADGNVTAYALTSDGKIRLPLRHICSKLNIVLTLGTEFSQSGGLGTQEASPITAMQVNSVYKQVLFDMTKGEFGEFKSWDGSAVTPGSVTLANEQGTTASANTWTPATDATGKAVATYHCILIPQTVAAGTFSVTFTLGGTNYKWAPTQDITFESGKEYTLPLAVGDDTDTPVSRGLSTRAWAVE